MNQIILEHGRDTDTGAAGAEKHETMFVGRYPGTTDRIYEATEDD